MKSSNYRFGPSLMILGALLLATAFCRAGQYTNFDVAIYIPVRVVQSFANGEKLSNEWRRISSQMKVDKVYIEVQRDRQLATDDLLEQVKRFFLDRGVRVAGGMALSDGGRGQFHSFCYTDPGDREFIRGAVELGARHFDELIQDDFFFVNTKTDSDIAAKGDRSWAQFRLDLMDEAAENLIIKPARAVNPKIKLIIKFPNWYEHFQGLGYDLDKEPKLFDQIYTGTETRDPEITDQNLQAYESYQIMRYFENIAPGRNGGGWVDTYNIRYADRYAEQLWDTMFAGARQMMLFEWSGMLRAIPPGERDAWRNLHTSFDYDEIAAASNGPASPVEVTAARIASYSLDQADRVVGKLGNPIGIAAYKPYQSTGEDFLHNYFGMIGIPIDLHPEFPTNANLVLLTESAKFDPEIVTKIKNQLLAGKSVVITSGLLRALQGKGIEDVVEVRYTDRKISARRYWTGFGAGDGFILPDGENADILFPEIDFLTNDAWALVRAMAEGRGYPLLLMDRYSKGVLYIWTIPENFNDLYRLPVEVTTGLRNYIMRGFPVQLDGPGQVALFAYDNKTFIVESFLPKEVNVKLSVATPSAKLRNLVTGSEIDGQSSQAGFGRGSDRYRDKPASFTLRLLPHSYSAFSIEK